MIQLNIFSGKMAGAQVVARHFPFRIGRASGNDLQLEDEGIWDQHLTLEFHKSQGFVLTVDANAIATVNGVKTHSQLLHNGDQITVGSARLQFWLAPPRQRGLRLREGFIWGLILLVTLGQFALIYWLLN